MALALQVKPENATEWYNLRIMYFETQDTRKELYNQQQRWQYNYAPFTTARFRIIENYKDQERTKSSYLGRRLRLEPRV